MTVVMAVAALDSSPSPASPGFSPSPLGRSLTLSLSAPPPAAGLLTCTY
jgi:hypothetical protein